MIRLAALPISGLRSVLPKERDTTGWHQVLTAAIAAKLTPTHAALLAQPVQEDQAIAWVAPGDGMRRFAELSGQDREGLTTATTSILSDIRRLAESGAAPEVAAAWPALRVIPDLNCVFAVDGRPVLACWGVPARSGLAGPLAAWDDGTTWRAPTIIPWRVYVGAMATLAALALLAGLLVPALGGLMLPAERVCRADPRGLALMREVALEEDRGAELKMQLAQLQEARGTQALQCPIPQRVVPAPAPSPPQPPPGDLPRQRWDSHDLGMLEGCWNNYTHLVLEDQATHQPLPVRTWVFCFSDALGHGRQTITLENGEKCENDLRATFGNDNKLRMVDASKCPFPRRPLVRGQLTCTWENEAEANCVRRDLEGPAAGRDQPGKFRRAEASAPRSDTGGSVAK